MCLGGRGMRSLCIAALVTGLALPRAAHADGVDFIKDAKLFYRVVACGGSDPLPATVDAATVDKHCAEMAKRYKDYNEKYAQVAETFFSGVRPANLPATVVYPFGGGDLGSALITYPQATEITTISLEH